MVMLKLKPETKVQSMLPSHFPLMWKVISVFPDNFNHKYRNYQEFLDYMDNTPKIGLVAFQDGELIGCSFIETVHNGFAEISIAMKRRTLTPDESFDLIQTNLKHLFEKYQYKMIYAVTDTSNIACVSLLNKLKFKFTHDLGSGRLMASIIKESVI